MAYETNSASSIQDLVDKLQTFAVANGWTLDEHIDGAVGQATIHRDDCYISFRWDSSPSTDLAIYQSLGWAGSSLPHAMPDDSGNGDTSVPISTDRRINFVSVGPFTAYHFFADTSPYYIHIAVEVDSGRFRHFGFGNLNKLGTWTGGEYCYGHYWGQTVSTVDLPTSTSHYFGLDGVPSSVSSCATLHVEDWEGQTVDEKWMVLGATTSAGVDRAGEDRLYGSGTSRGGLWAYALSWIPMVRLNAYKPFIPIEVLYRDVTTAPDTWILMGTQPDIALVNMKHFNPGDTITFGGEDWLVFPWVRKQHLLADTEESWNAGVAYRKIT